jgi:hypothetical protein
MGCGIGLILCIAYIMLTRSLIHSFILRRFSDSVRDPHSVKWIEEFLETSNQLQFHGTGAGYIQHFGG